MKNSLYRNFLIIGIIIPFFGVSIVPTISGDIGEIKNDLSSPIEKGSTVWDHICGFIYNLHIEENVTSFTILIAAGLRIMESDNGGFVAFVWPHFLEHICWTDEHEFSGVLLPHFIKGVVEYRIE